MSDINWQQSNQNSNYSIKNFATDAKDLAVQGAYGIASFIPQMAQWGVDTIYDSTKQDRYDELGFTKKDLPWYKDIGYQALDLIKPSVDWVNKTMDEGRHAFLSKKANADLEQGNALFSMLTDGKSIYDDPKAYVNAIKQVSEINPNWAALNAVELVGVGKSISKNVKAGLSTIAKNNAKIDRAFARAYPNGGGKILKATSKAGNVAGTAAFQTAKTKDTYDILNNVRGNQ